LIESSHYFFEDPSEFDPKTMRKRWKNSEVNELVSDYIECLEQIEDWSSENVEAGLRKLSDEKEVNPAKLIHPVRLALSGTGAGPSLFHLMDVLGKETCIRRLKRAVELFPIFDNND
jgi:glutamyl-tRNA synthetase